jgi:hypothetical protein
VGAIFISQNRANARFETKVLVKLFQKFVGVGKAHGLKKEQSK